MPGALTGDRQNDVRVDGGEGDVDHFEASFRKSFPQEHVQVTAGSERRLRIAHGRGFSEDKNAVCTRRFMNFHPDRTGIASDFRRKEPKAEVVILNEEVLILYPKPLEKGGGITIARKAQGKFQSKEDSDRQNHT